MRNIELKNSVYFPTRSDLGSFSFAQRKPDISADSRTDVVAFAGAQRQPNGDSDSFPDPEPERKPVAGTDEHSSEESPAEAPGEEGPPPEVGILLERMNTAAEDVNNLEAQLLSTQKAYEQNAEAWSEAVLAWLVCLLSPKLSWVHQA